MCLAIAALTAESEAQSTHCSTFAVGKHFASTSCYTTPVKRRPDTFLSPQGVFHYWSKQNRTYCYSNEYGNERCIDSIDRDRLMCAEMEGALYCRPFP